MGRQFLWPNEHPRGGLSNVVSMAAGSFHNLALKSDGTVAGWGYNGNGQTTIPVGLRNVPVTVGGMIFP